MMVLATCLSQVLPSSVQPSSGSDLLRELLSLQMLLLIQAGPTSNLRTLLSSIMCGEAFILRSSFGMTLALKKEAEGQPVALLLRPSDVFLSRARIQGSPEVTSHSRLPHSQPPLTPCCSGAASISYRMSESTHHSKLLITSFQSSQIPGLLCPPCPGGSIHSPKWKPGVREQQPCVFASAHPDPQGFLEVLQDCTSKHKWEFLPSSH